MSSAQNHRKRSHRSERVNKSNAGVFTTKRMIVQANKPKQSSFIKRFFNKIFNKKEI